MNSSLGNVIQDCVCLLACLLSDWNAKATLHQLFVIHFCKCNATFYMQKCFPINYGINVCSMAIIAEKYEFHAYFLGKLLLSWGFRGRETHPEAQGIIFIRILCQSAGVRRVSSHSPAPPRQLPNAERLFKTWKIPLICTPLGGEEPKFHGQALGSRLPGTRPEFLKVESLQCGFGRETPKFRFEFWRGFFGGFFPPIFSKEEGPKKSTKKSPTKFTRDFVRKNSPRISAEAFPWEFLDFPENRQGKEQVVFSGDGQRDPKISLALEQPRLAPVQPWGCPRARDNFGTLRPSPKKTACSFPYRFSGKSRNSGLVPGKRDPKTSDFVHIWGSLMVCRSQGRKPTSTPRCLRQAPASGLYSGPPACAFCHKECLHKAFCGSSFKTKVALNKRGLSFVWEPKKSLDSKESSEAFPRIFWTIRTFYAQNEGFWEEVAPQSSPELRPKTWEDEFLGIPFLASICKAGLVAVGRFLPFSLSDQEVGGEFCVSWCGGHGGNEMTKLSWQTTPHDSTLVHRGNLEAIRHWTIQIPLPLLCGAGQWFAVAKDHSIPENDHSLHQHCEEIKLFPRINKTHCSEWMSGLLKQHFGKKNFLWRMSPTKMHHELQVQTAIVVNVLSSQKAPTPTGIKSHSKETPKEGFGDSGKVAPKCNPERRFPVGLLTGNLLSGLHFGPSFPESPKTSFGVSFPRYPFPH